jgi:phosphatidylinositol-3-phosphatase
MLFDGPMEQAGRYEQRITHYNILRTIEDLSGLPRADASPDAAPTIEKWAVPPIRDG